ncbi:MAG: energy-coupling factor ABC transporter ATP-binding protein [Spirochaetaceae bacterium]|jgi:cobalt/nickel transport system ATP-binding protein|nr:energy-coupling factor ABC transporter ATP-binding protein [Spirochaetaceae bacterium]GMO22460.1 MAG: ABC transporter ATP-binding protein [Termitinemataceae bacterium]
MSFELLVKNLFAAYPGSMEGDVLNGISFSAAKGERIALIGANGAGKSTLLLCFTGIIPVREGEIFVCGLNVEKKNLPAVRQNAALVFQNPDDQLFTSSVWEDVLFGPLNYLEQQKLPPAFRAERHVQIEAEAKLQLEKLGILYLKDKMPHKLSGGEKRQAALACVLVMNPRILLLDEPSAHLDPRARRALISTLGGLPQTQIIATHDFDLAKALCSRAIILHKGQIHAEGDTAALLSNTALLEECGL